MKPLRPVSPRIGLLLVLALCIPSLFAQPPASAGLGEIIQQQQRIRAELQAGAEQYRYVDSFRRRQIYAAQNKLFALAEGHRSLAELKADDQLAVFNALKQIESNLVKSDVDERLVCERTQIVGTRRYEMACMTQAERDRRATRAVETLMNRPACTEPGCI